MPKKNKFNPAKERTVILLKPDTVKRGLVGEILSRFEKVGLKIVALKMIWVKAAIVAQHYSDNKKYLIAIGEKTLKAYQEYGLDPHKDLGTKDAYAIGKMVRKWNMDFLTSGPVVAVLLEGLHAVDEVRMIVGHTLPRYALPGTIRGDFSLDSPVLANLRKRSVKNIIHASGSVKEAKLEEKLWFHNKEIFEYKRADEDIMF